MEDDTPGWFAVRDGIMSVWEGVCMLKLADTIYLFKIKNKNPISIKLMNNSVNRVSSDGYWYCVEISGGLSKAKASFYYHADCTRNARQMLKHLTTFLCGMDISSLIIRLDPDPLRCSSLENIIQRVAMWSQLGREFCTNCRIVLDSKMPL